MGAFARHRLLLGILSLPHRYTGRALISAESVCLHSVLFIWLAYNPRYIWVPLAALVISWGGIARYCPVHKPQPIDNSQPGFP